MVPDDADADVASAIMDDTDAAAEEFAAVLAEKLEADIPPIAEFDAVADPQRGMIAYRETGPQSPCNKLVLIVIVLMNLRNSLLLNRQCGPFEPSFSLLYFRVLVCDFGKLLRGISRS